MNVQVAILLATYNGEKFIEKQLDSLLGQSFQQFKIYIHDDGSNDKTLEIIRSYESQFPGKFVIFEEESKHLGAAFSFMWLLNRVEAPYYMFCDQDDIWFPQKIELTLKKMKEIEYHYPMLPIVIHTDLQVVDDKLNIIYRSMWDSMKLIPELLQKFNYLAVCNCCTGCTMLINHKLKSYVFPIPSNIPMHDFWIALMGAKYGIVENLSQTTILYRQHECNTIGVQHITKYYYLNKIVHLFNTVRQQIKIAKFCSSIGYSTWLKFYWYKMLYFFKRL